MFCQNYYISDKYKILKKNNKYDYTHKLRRKIKFYKRKNQLFCIVKPEKKKDRIEDQGSKGIRQWPIN